MRKKAALLNEIEKIEEERLVETKKFEKKVGELDR